MVDRDNYSGRLGVLADAAVVLGPALVPLEDEKDD